jgi:uncharacterized protein (DUF169 family)
MNDAWFSNVRPQAGHTVEVQKPLRHGKGLYRRIGVAGGGTDMDLAQKVQNRFGNRWVKIKFFEETPSNSESDPFQGERFCEAVTESYLRPLIIRSENILCPAAQYVFGWNGDIGSEIVKTIHKELGFPTKRAEAIVNELPRLRRGCRAIGLNQNGEPDVLISYCQPEQVMQIVRAYQEKTGKAPVVRLSAVASICAHTALAAFLEEGLHLSFGCPNARKYGKIGRDRLAVGVSRNLAATLTE